MTEKREFEPIENLTKMKYVTASLGQLRCIASVDLIFGKLIISFLGVILAS